MTRKHVRYPKIGDDFFTAIAVLRAEMPDAGVDAVMAAMKERFPDVLQRNKDALIFKGLSDGFTKMWHVFEETGVARIGPNEELIVLRKPSLSDFRQVALSAEMPNPKDWIHLYEMIFGKFVEQKGTIQ